jgi:hypothetical protein
MLLGSSSRADRTNDNTRALDLVGRELEHLEAA